MKNYSRRSFVTNISLLSGALLPCALKADPLKKAIPPKKIPKIKTYRHGELTVNTLVLGHLRVNCFIVSDSKHNCIVIDPGAEADVILNFIKKNTLKVKAYILTHSHLDHISALDECFKALPAPVAMHPEENDWAFCEKNQWLPFYPQTEKVEIARPLKHEQHFSDAALQYTVLHTPGHSPGSVCFWFPEQKIIFSGDTLFAGTIGRTDLHRSSRNALLNSLRTFLPLPPETIIYPGHGQITTVKTEIASNPFFALIPSKIGKTNTK